MSAVISKVFSFYGVPYDVDFPVYEQVPISQKVLDTLHNNLLWTEVDVSNGNQRTGNIDVYTLCPGQPILERLWGAIGANLRDCVDIKIRLYIKRYPDGSRECCIVPMCLFKEIPQDKLSTLYDLLKPANQSLAMSEEDSWKAQMRYLEFYIAHQLFIIFSELTSLGRGIMFYENIVKQLFGPIDGETVCGHLSASRIQSSGTPLVIHRAQADYSEIIKEYRKSDIYNNLCKESSNWDYGSEYQKGCWINQFIFSFFLWWYDTKEIVVRNTLKARRLHYVTDYETIQTYLYRLKNGLPMSALRQMLQALVADLSDEAKLSDLEAESAISVFIDRAIDEGIIVPTIHYGEDGEYLCRAYRHGEDLPFGAADQYRLVLFLHSLGTYICEAEGCKIPAVAEISLEKMIVLFYQMGLRRGNIFNRFLGFDETDIIHSFLSVHGSIQGYTSPDAIPHIYSEKAADGTRYITWLTSWLYEVKLIETQPEDADTTVSAQPIPIILDKAEKYLKENQRSAVSDEVQLSIISIAELISSWYNGMIKAGKRKEFRDNVTALTSCANRFVYLSAIATEIHYFNNYWKNQAKYALQETGDSQHLVDRLTDSKGNKRYTAITIQGLHSGRDKILWRYPNMDEGKNQNKAQEVIDMVAKNFLNSTGASVWTQLWCRIDEEPEGDTHQLNLSTNMAEAFLYFFSASFECLKSTDFWENGALPPDYTSYKSCYLERALRTSKLDSSLFDALEEIAGLDGTNLEQKSTQLYNLICEALFTSEQCVETIETLVRDMDPTYTVSFKSALILDIATLVPDQIESALLRFWEQLPEDHTKTELNLIRFPRDKEDHSPCYKYGIFLGHISRQLLDIHPSARKSESLQYGNFLYTAFKTVCSLLNGCLCQIRGILLPHIIQGSTFNHNLQRNIDKYASDFYKSIVKPLEACYDDKLKMQLVLGLDRHVDQQFIKVFQTGWQTSTLNLPINRAEWITNCIVCGKNHVEIVSKPSLMNRITYSQLKINCGDDQGLGLLLRLSDRVVCVSCNHIFTDYSKENEPCAVSAYAPEVKFPLRPLTQIRPYQSDTHVLLAQDEVILLEPCWNGNIPFDLSMLISLEDWADPEVDVKCRCYGGNGEDAMKWVSSIHVGGAISKGYYQIDADDGKDLDGIQMGFSGGTYVRTDTQADHKIIGIHEGRFDGRTRARMIPRVSVQAAIETLFRKE